MKKTKNSQNYSKEILALLASLHSSYPNENLGWHISLATSDYPDLCVVSDKELLFAFQKYEAERELDVNTALASEEYVNGIEDDAKHLFDKKALLDSEWEEEDEDEY